MLVVEGFQKFAGIPSGLARIFESLMPQQIGANRRKNRSIQVSNTQEARLKKIAIIAILLIPGLLAWGSQIKGEEEVPILKNVSLYQQYQKTMKDMEVLGEAILGYATEHENAPEAGTLSQLLQLDCGNGLTIAEFFFDQIPEAQIPLKDVWENDFLYKYQKDRFWIASPGSDGKFEGFEQTGCYPDTEPYLQGKDIILSNEGFVFFPLEKEQFYKLTRLFLTLFSFVL
jgi:hypothetical protein